ncbi:MAG: DUF58 domain-containing protein [Planctomycetes bacterium]|nr:DUF58 domain-containing protein [Planctomycetota bacterium]
MNAFEFLKPETVKKLARLDIQAKMIVEGFYAGLHQSAQQGFSATFSEHLKYTPGDDVRGIDFRVLARTDRFYVKKFEAETQRDSAVIVDVSGSMGYASKSSLPSKYEYAIYLSAALTYMMTLSRDPCGLMIASDTVRRTIKPRTGLRQFALMLSELVRAKPEGASLLPALIENVGLVLRHRGLAIIVSDFLMDLGSLSLCLARLAHRRYDVVAFQILDPAEIDFQVRDSVILRDLETGNEVYVDPRIAKKGYQREFDRHQNELRKIFLDANQGLLTLDTSHGFEEPLRHFLRQRSRKR